MTEFYSFCPTFDMREEYLLVVMGCLCLCLSLCYITALKNEIFENYIYALTNQNLQSYLMLDEWT